MQPRLTGALLAVLALAAPLVAQRPTVTAADYARAEKFLGPNLQGLVVGSPSQATTTSG